MKYKSFGDKFLVSIFYVITVSFALACLLPLWVALVASFSNEVSLVHDGYKLWINHFDLTAYRLIFTGTDTVLNAYGITILTTVCGVALTILLTSSLAYPLTVPSLKYRNGLSLFAYATMLFNGGLVPTYILTTRFLHMGNSLWVLIVPGALNAYNMFLMKNYFSTIPDSLSESAKIDGASDIYIYFRIILPLAKPIIATIALFSAMGYWNEWFRVLLYIDNTKLFTLQYLIMQLQQQVDFITSSLNPAARSSMGNIAIPTISIRLSTAMVSIGPIILLYPLLQRYFIKGIMIGAVKG
jgi:putative aldouronate transport system permease protein